MRSVDDRRPRSIDLAGDWLLRADRGDAGVRERWWSGAHEEERWTIAAVPAAWQKTFGVDDPAVVWYRRTVELPAGWLAGGGLAWLCFDSVATDIRVWVHGEEVGRHIGDWVGFEFDVTRAVRAGGVVEVVARVDKVKAGAPAWVDGAPVSGGHITKGFHDVLSIQHGGIWGGVRLERSGGVRAVPNGVSVITEGAGGGVRATAELACCRGGGEMRVEVRDRAGRLVGCAAGRIEPGSCEVCVRLDVEKPELWWPDSPALYSAEVVLGDSAGEDRHSVRFGFRKVAAGGAGGRRLLLNGRPIFLRGVLDWGHEPEHIAPSPAPDEVRERFSRLRVLGFNCVCVCMWYPPRWFYEIADETGMLIWQEHPVWKPPMGDALIPEYQRQFACFFRRDANHPSVVLVSGSCEHERFNPKLGAWWWEEARRRLPDRALQVQTAFFAWTDPARTDLHDEHTYESSGRWVRYLEEVRAALSERGAKPFIMGESILYTSWPDVGALLEQASIGGEKDSRARRADDGLPWWHPKGLRSLAALEESLVARHGAPVVERFKRDADHYHLRGRKFQMERFRAYPEYAGLVMNHLRDVPACRCGFVDDLGRWRFRPEEFRPWMNDAPILLWTPEHRRGFFGGRGIGCRVAVANFGKEAIDTVLVVRSGDGEGARVVRAPIRCTVGEVASAPAPIELPAVDRPTRYTVACWSEEAGLVENRWDLWVLPRGAARSAPGTVRLSGIDFVRARDEYPDFEEHAYSGGWGLKVGNPVCVLPDPAVLRPDLPAWPADTALQMGVRVVLTHRLTERLVGFAAAGGCVLHLASKGPGSMPTRYVSMWGQMPFIRIDQALGAGVEVHDCVLDLLDYDLTRRLTRGLPSGELGIADMLDPLVRLIYTHDMTAEPKVLDAVAAARVGSGSIIVSTLDHSGDAGAWLLGVLLDFAVSEPRPGREIDPEVLRRWTVERSMC